MLGVAAAQAVLACVAPPPDVPEDEDLPRSSAMPGAATASRGDVGTAVATEAAKVADEFRPWEVGGFVDLNYAYNHNLPDNHVNRGTAAQPRTGEWRWRTSGATRCRGGCRRPSSWRCRPVRRRTP